MVNDIITAIASAIYTEFGSGTVIYTESVEQGMSEPCFFIQALNPTSRIFFGKRYFCENPFCIQYIPSATRKMEECNTVAQSLFSCLELITESGDEIRGTQMNYEIVDGVLNFFVNYDLFVYKTDEDDDTEVMEVLDQTSEVNNGG